MDNPYAAPLANSPGNSAGGPVSAGTMSALKGTQPWVRFISVMLWIGVAGMLILAVLMATVMFGQTMAPQQAQMPFGPSSGLIFAGIYALFALFYIYPAVKLGAYASSIKRLTASCSVPDLETALRAQQRFWQFLGIITLVVLLIYFLILAGAIIVGIVSSVHH